jgi:pimeloyl-ACP methyl ester carboxylesterase
MRLRGPLVAALATVATWTCIGSPAATAQAQIAWAPCGRSNEYACGHLTVPLDPGGSAPGTITLALRRHRASVGEAHEAIVALAGGPGQAALPFAEDFAHLLGPIAATRDLIVFDQRGIGLSHPLSCHRFELDAYAGDGGGASEPAGRQLAECAAQLGAERAFYTTADTVADIEAIRAAGGYERLVLYGTSYGTKVAERYAQTYPTHVSALVLDSVVPPNGPEPLNLPTFAAIPRVLRALCYARACAHITPEPVADLARLVRRMRRTPGGVLRGRWIDGDGHAHTARFSAATLLDVLIAGDLEPVLRAEFPAAVRAAAGGDTAQLARLVHGAEERGEGEEAESPAESFDTPLYFATSCEEEPFPWDRAASPATRLAEARARLAALPQSALGPFPVADALSISDMPACAYWPYTAPAPAPVNAPFPAVPTLILSGAEDLRTPTANARVLAAQIPGSHLLVVPGVGHSVLGTDLSGCASRALQALFKPAPIVPCRAGAPQILRLLHLTPLAPARLQAVPAAPHTRGLPGRTLTAVDLTLSDLARQVAIRALGALESGNLGGLASLRIGGLRAGWAAGAKSGLQLHSYSYIPGVTVSGRIGSDGVVLRVGGTAAAHGTLRLSGRGRRALTGKLGGSPVRSAQAANPSASAAIVRFDAHAATTYVHGGSARERSTRGGPTRSGPTRSGSTPGGPVRSGSTPVGPTQSGSTQDGSSRSGSTGDRADARAGVGAVAGLIERIP